MAETHSCTTPQPERRSADQTERETGRQIAQIMSAYDRLNRVDREAIRAAVDKVIAALEPFTPHGRQRVLDFAREEDGQ